ncbi:hypothetical protein [Paraburkholderia tropica]|uniref:Uncharacterized protein n=1 Tax=Paraburkholderia tropica TaxID=92647 RepID=A0A1A5XJ19_9BURK|nr:hypothetical protein [Paraburkholderia tropica]MBB2979871.1 hypothetical protein [Paraburkholderia tropica]OBR53334.1 hypothetical protein A6456_15125 [Paraburkholderia tropica]QNB15880.1 hypothetical protein G5S35_30440 [Paraburkholderia tropica]RQN39325.1 hypothetical protein EHZ25_08690 [Paraburkholderia tropica]SEJ69811.1 hypothetical protein SAMN05216550_107237 [Paraburkholderia tropica]
MDFSPSRQHLDLTGPLTVPFQLVNESLAQMRMIDVGQVFRGCTVDGIIRTLFTQASPAATVDGERAVLEVTMVPLANRQPREPIMNPQRVRLVEHFQ